MIFLYDVYVYGFLVGDFRNWYSFEFFRDEWYFFYCVFGDFVLFFYVFINFLICFFFYWIEVECDLWSYCFYCFVNFIYIYIYFVFVIFVNFIFVVWRLEVVVVFIFYWYFYFDKYFVICCFCFENIMVYFDVIICFNYYFRGVFL